MSDVMVLLGISATLTSLIVEALKKMNPTTKIPANVVAAVVSVFTALLVSLSYLVMNGVAFTPQIFINIVFLILLSWLISMLGFDKVTQAINQLNAFNKK